MGEAVPNLVELLVAMKPAALWTCMACRVRASASWYSLESKWLCGYPICKHLLRQDGQGSADAHGKADALVCMPPQIGELHSGVHANACGSLSDPTACSAAGAFRGGAHHS